MQVKLLNKCDAVFLARVVPVGFPPVALYRMCLAAFLFFFYRCSSRLLGGY